MMSTNTATAQRRRSARGGASIRALNGGNRPIYETGFDLTNERDFAADLESYWQMKLQKLPIKYHVDFAAMRADDIAALIEIKCRQGDRVNQSDMYFIAVDKLMNGIRLAEFMGVPFLLVIRCDIEGEFQDWFCDVIEAYPDMLFKIAGRSDRDDPDDVEPCAFIPTRFMKRIVY